VSDAGGAAPGSFARQLSLDVALHDPAGFGNFEPGGNGALLDHLQALAEADGAANCYLWGVPGSGRSHLLIALCRHAADRGRRVGYLSLTDRSVRDAGLDAVDGVDLLALDDLDAIAGDGALESALFALYNRMFDRGAVLVASGMQAPASLGITLDDLLSRIGAGAVYRIVPLDDAARARALSLRARQRGIGLADDVVRYILTRYPRDMRALMALLDRLDAVSLVHKRRVTLPLLRSLEQGGPG